MMTMTMTEIMTKTIMMVTKIMKTQTFEVSLRPLVDAAVSRIKAASSTRPLVIIIVVVMIVVIMMVIIFVVIVIIVMKLITWRAASEGILL